MSPRSSQEFGLFKAGFQHLWGVIQQCLSDLSLFIGFHKSLLGVLTESFGDLSIFFFCSILQIPIYVFVSLLRLLEVLFSLSSFQTQVYAQLFSL